MSSVESEGLSSTIIALSKDLLPILPEMEGRIIAVSEMEVTRTNTPTFPIAMIGLQEITFEHDEKSNKLPMLTEVIVAEFWFKSRKVKFSNNTETPFWSYYDYDPLLRKLVSFLLGWKSPKGYKLRVVRMDLESSELAVQVSFTLRHRFDFCPIEDDEGEEARVIPNISLKTQCEQP